MTRSNSDDAIVALEQFVIGNDDLLELERRIGRFNVFDALGVTYAEIRHSKFLAFLLDPQESHGFGQLFLRPFLQDLLSRVPRRTRPVSPIDLDGDDLQGVVVQREWEHIDLLITSKQPAFVIAIENKVFAGEHGDQLNRYVNAVEKAYPGLPTLYVYLTPDERPASDDRWIPYSYGKLYLVLSRIRETNRGVIGEDVGIFLDHYLSLIRSRFMQDPQIDDLCRKLFKNHRQALQLIFERVGDPSAALTSDIEAVVNADPRWTVVWRTKTYLDFLPSEWLNWLPALGSDYSETRAWIVLRFEWYNGKLDYYAQVNQVSDPVLRRRVLDWLQVHGPKFGLVRKGAQRSSESYTRISSRENVARYQDPSEYVSGSLDGEIRAKLDAVYEALHGLPEEMKPVLSSPV